MRIVIGAAVLAVASAATGASAQQWNGFHVGGYVGGARASSDVDADLGPLSGFTPVDGAAVSRAGSPSLHPKGAAAGIQFGYDRRLGDVVIGAEADFGYFGLSDKSSGRRPFPSTLPGGIFGPPTTTFSSFTKVETDYLFTLRPRVGYAYGDALVYVTGGLAVSKVKLKQDFRYLAPFTSSQSTSDTKAGWALGGGVEYALAADWSVKAEYLHVDLGSVKGRAKQTPAFAGFSLVTSTDLTIDMGRVGVNYRF